MILDSSHLSRTFQHHKYIKYMAVCMLRNFVRKYFIYIIYFVFSLYIYQGSFQVIFDIFRELF